MLRLMPSGCLEWTGWRHPRGYGKMTVHVDGKQTGRLTHRVAWELANGPIPEGMLVCHRCDNPSCCNPDHLFLGTDVDNMRDAREKGRAVRGERATPSRLKDGQVREIHAILAAPNPPNDCELGRRYGVWGSTIRDIRIGRTWAWMDTFPTSGQINID